MPDGTQTTDEYTAGTSNTIPYGTGTKLKARSKCWLRRTRVFVVTTAPRSRPGGKEILDLSCSIDDDGRLIMNDADEVRGGLEGSRW